LNGGERGVHGGGDTSDVPAVFHLQTIVSTIVITDGVEAQSLVAMGDNGFEICFFLNGRHSA